MDVRGIKIKRRNLSLSSAFDFAVAFYLFSLMFSDGTIIFFVSAFLVLAIGSIHIFAQRKLFVCGFTVLMALFILYNLFLILTGVAVFQAESTKRLITLVYNFVVNLVLMQYWISERNRKKTQKTYIIILVILALYIVVLSGRALFNGRFGGDIPYLFNMTGTNGKGMLSNYVSRLLYIGVVFCYLLYWHEQDTLQIDLNANKYNRYYLIIAYIFVTLVALTGSRSGLIVVAVFLILAYLFRSTSYAKKIKYLIGVSFVLFFAYLLIMYVPVLYEIIGSRLRILIDGFVLAEGYEYRSSAYFRSNMRVLGEQLFKEKPVFGWGLDAFTKLSPYDTYSHNNFIEILVSCGIIGFILYYGALFSLFIKCIKENGKSRTEAKVYISILVATVFMHVAHVDYVSRDSWLLLNMIAAASLDWRMNKREENI